MLYEFNPVPLEGQKVTTALAMAEMEKKAIVQNDATGAEYMKRAAAGIFDAVVQFVDNGGFDKHVIILGAKGNNTGDAYATGNLLLEDEYTVTALQLFSLEECSELTQVHAKEFQKKGGQIIFFDEIASFIFPHNAIILDGLLGTGFKGKVEGKMGELIERVNASHQGVISIDIPSGVSGDTGRVDGAAIYADLTVYLGLLKLGHLFNQGYEHVGQLTCVDFGISQKYIDNLKPAAYVVHPDLVRKNLPHHRRTSNKYSVGQVAIVAGSLEYPGAAIITAHAALKSGAGLVRHYCQEGLFALVTAMKPEVIRTRCSIEAIVQESSKIKCLVVGPGIGREEETKDFLEKLYQVGKFPFVIDADALYFFNSIEKEAVLTPHRGELCRLLDVDSSIGDIDLLDKAEAFAKEKKVTLVCKGAPTTIVSFEGHKIVIPYGNKGMASGGMGDALAGIVGSLIAQGKRPHEAAVLGAALHALAGDYAARIHSEAALTASDLINSLPTLFLEAESFE